MIWPVVLSATCLAVAAGVVWSAPASLAALGPPARGVATVGAEEAPGWLHRWRIWWALSAGLGAWAFVGGIVAVPAGIGAAVGTWVVIGRAEPPAVRRRRELVRRDLPHLVTLLAASLRAGAAPARALTIVTDALPGPASDRLALVSSRLALGADPVQVWGALSQDLELAPLARAMSRAQVTGTSVVAAVEALGGELSLAARAEVEDRARSVGVKAAVPLGLCLLPAFLLLGIAPLVAGLLEGLAW